jgi:hypothetical protein
MLGATNDLVSGVLICGGMAMCVFAILTTCWKGRTPKPLHLMLAIFWAFIATIYVFAHMS